jgi:hypothetical protein
VVLTKYTVYRVTNTINGKTYIGCHRTHKPDDRYFGSGYLILKAIKKYRKCNFTKEVLFVYDNADDMYEKEIELIALYRPEYNIAMGGVGDFRVYGEEYRFNRGSYDRSKVDYSKFKGNGWYGRRTPEKHGTIGEYQNYKCRCGACKYGWNEYVRKTRLAKSMSVCYN